MEQLTLLDLCPLPLANARAAGIRQHSAADLIEDVNQPIALDGCSNLLASRRHREWNLRLQCSQ